MQITEILNFPIVAECFNLKNYVGSNNAITNVCFDLRVKLVESYDEERSIIIRKFILDALNEKWERQFGEPKRWGLAYHGVCFEIECRNCAREQEVIDSIEDDWQYCPSCGVRLLPPEDDK